MNRSDTITTGGAGQTASRVIVKTPEAGASRLVIANAGSSFVLDFDPSGADMSREGDNLTFSVAGRGAVTISDYFAPSEAGPANFILPDGTVASAADVLGDLADITTHAGQENPVSNGINEYSDAAGALIGGVDRLGSLGTDYWSSGMEPVEFPHLMGDETGAASGPSFAPSAQRPVEPPVEPHTYDARAVIYANDPTKENSVTTEYLDSRGQPVQGDPLLAFLDGDGEDFVAWSYDGDGNLVFTLTDEGKAYLAADGSPEYIETLYEVVDQTTGETYTIQVVVPKDGRFDAQDFAENGSRYGAPVGDEDLIHGEWHEGDSDTWRDYRSTSSNLDDTFTFNGLYEGTDIRTGYGQGHWGNDTLTINGDIDNLGGTVNIITGKGDDSVSFYAMYANEGGSNLIDTGRDLGDRVDMTWKMHAEGTHNAREQTSGNTIVTGDLRIESGTNYGMYAANTNQGPNNGGNGASNTVDAAGDVNISATQYAGWEASAMRADNQSQGSGHVSNTIKADGDVILRVDDNVDNATQVAGVHAGTWYATDHGTAANEVAAGGRVFIDAEGGRETYGMFALNEAVNNVKGGSIDIDAVGKGYVAGVQSSAKDSAGNNWWTTGGKNLLESSAVDILAHSSGGEAYAVATGKYGSTEITGLTNEENTFEFEAEGASAYGVVSYDNGDLPSSAHGTVITGGDRDDSVIIRARGEGSRSDDGYAIGIYGGSTGHNAIDTGAGFDIVSIEAKGTGNAMGMSAGSNKQVGKGWGGTDASNTLKNAEDVAILAESSGGNAYGIFTNTGILPQSEMNKLDPGYDTGFNKIIMGDDGIGDRELTVTARALGTGANSGNAVGMSAYNQNSLAAWGYNLVEGSIRRANTITVEAESRGGEATGLFAQGPTSRSAYKSGNTIHGGDRADTIVVSAAGATVAIGMQAGTSPGLGDNPTFNEIDSGLGRDRIRLGATATGRDGNAMGLLAYSGGHNILTAQEGDVDINVRSRYGEASGIMSMGSDALNTVTAPVVELEVEAGGDAFGLRADQTQRSYDGGRNVVTGSDVAITVTAEGKAYGMYSYLAENSSNWSEGGVNIVRAMEGKAISVVIKVEAGSADDAYAMYAGGKGENSILGGEQGDTVELVGRIEGNNLIDTGAGDDTVSLNGQVDVNLILTGGDGYDLLILMADDAVSFTDNYREWLETITDDQLRSMSIEEIWINGKEGADWMNDLAMEWFRDFVDHYNDLTGNNVCPVYDDATGDVAMAFMAGMLADGLEQDVSSPIAPLPTLLLSDGESVDGLLPFPMDGEELVVHAGQSVPDDAEVQAALLAAEHAEISLSPLDNGDTLALMLMCQSDLI